MDQLHRGCRVLVLYPEENLWHERLLCVHLVRSRWVVATPSGDVYDEDILQGDGLEPVGPRGGTRPILRGQPFFRFTVLSNDEEAGLLATADEYFRTYQDELMADDDGEGDGDGTPPAPDPPPLQDRPPARRVTFKTP